MKLFFLSKIFFVFAFVSLFSEDSLRIVFSKGIGSENYSKYFSFLQATQPSIISINAYGLDIDKLDSALGDFDGLVLTGGPDIHPKFYGQEKDTPFCEIDLYRDSLEFKLLDIAFRKKLPILAICRGEQILNVYLGGTLYPDISTFAPGNVRHRCDENGAQCLHQVYVDNKSLFYQIVSMDSFNVNSFHHQAVATLGKNLRAVARSSDGLIESFEWVEPLDKPFFIAVQWHLERLGITDKVSFKLSKWFLEEVRKRKVQVKN